MYHILSYIIVTNHNQNEYKRIYYYSNKYANLIKEYPKFNFNNSLN